MKQKSVTCDNARLIKQQTIKKTNKISKDLFNNKDNFERLNKNLSKNEQEIFVEVKNLTKDYKNNRGIFDINLYIKKGEVFGFVGTNGSGKTTTIRHIMGFLKPEQGSCYVKGLNSWKCASEIKKFVSYIPGEIAFPDLSTGTEFLKNQAELLGLTNMNKANELIKKLGLDTSANLKRMSKGMKQKTAIVAALMADKEILILDEPTTGLDPLMRQTFLEILKEEKLKGKTILMSSQMFDELECICDRVALILDGKIIETADINDIKNSKNKTLKIEFTNENDYNEFKKLNYIIIRDQSQYNQVTIKIKKDELNNLFKALKKYEVKFISEIKYSLEKHFKDVLHNLSKNKLRKINKKSKP